jgi:hypothetical protein
MRTGTPTRRGNAYPRANKATSTGEKFSFQRAALPTPPNYFQHVAKLELKGGGEWRDALCPFHGDKSPSLRVNIVKGAFCCMACGAKGGDVLAFHMQLNGLGFIAAAKSLGAWCEDKK